MAGIGQGVGASDFSGSFQKGRDDARKNRQWNLMEEEQKRKQEIEAQQASIAKSSGANVQSIAEETKANTETLQKNQRRASGKLAQDAVAKAVTSASDVNAAGDLVTAIDASPELQSALQVKKGDYRAFDSTSKADNDSFLKYLNKNDVDYTDWTPEYIQETKEAFADSGLYYMAQDGLVDISSIVPKMGALKGAGKSATNVFEGKKANVEAMTQGEAGYKSWIKEQGADTEKVSFFRDYADSLPPSQRDKLIGRKEEISGQSHEQNMADIETLKTENADTDMSDPTAGQEIPKEVPVDTISEPVKMEKNENGTETGKGMITQADGTKVGVSVNKDINGNTKAKGDDGSSATVQKDGAGVFKSANGDVTTVGSNGQSVTVAPNGKVTSNDYVLPDSVQMAYDMMGVKSQFSKKNVQARQIADETNIRANKNTEISQQNANTAQTNSETSQGQLAVAQGNLTVAQEKLLKSDSAMGKYVDDFVEMELGTAAEGLASFEKQKLSSNRAPTYVEEFRKSSAWLANNPDKKGTAEYDSHKTVMDRFSNSLQTAEMKNNKATSATIMENYGLDMKDMYEPSGKVSPNGKIIDSKIRGNKDIYTKEVKKRETEAYDTAQSVANLSDLGVKIAKGVKDGTYKSGYLDSAANWAQTKAGTDFIYEATSGEIGAKLETQLGIEGELAIELGRVVKAAYGGNASNTDRETIAGAMAGMTSDDETVRKKSFDNFQRTMKKLNAQNMQFFSQQGLHVTTERLSDTANTTFDSQGNINEGKTSSKRSEVKKGTRAQFEAKEKGVTFYKGGKPFHFNKNGQLANGAA